LRASPQPHATVATGVAVLERTSFEAALAAVTRALWNAHPRGFFIDALHRLPNSDRQD
jgi:hypothetical protein